MTTMKFRRRIYSYRYGMLKRAVKRTVMHLRLQQSSSDEPTSTSCCAAGSTAKTRSKDEQRRRTDHVNSKCIALRRVNTSRQTRERFRCSPELYQVSTCVIRAITVLLTVACIGTFKLA